MSGRDCNNCIRCTPNIGCTAWDCDFISRKDAIELYESVTRCKDCRSYEPDDAFCRFWNDYMGEQGYCSCGERRKEDKPGSLLEAMAKFRAEEKEQSDE